MSGDTPAATDGDQDDLPAAPPGLPPYPVIGTVSVERGAAPDAEFMVQDADMSGESGPDTGQ